MSNAAIQRYFQAVEKIVKGNQGTEHTYRPALKALFEELLSGITAINEPKRISCGAPDYVIERDGLTIGYIEAKDINEPLDKLEKDEQLTRYRRALGNLIFTDYLEFRWFVQGEGNLAEKKMTARLASKSGNKLIFDKEGAAKVLELLTSFLEHKAVDITKPEDLAKRMARLTHMIRDVIVQAFKGNEASKTMRSQLIAFDKTLLPGITEEQFADMFAQTLAYGLFAARYNHTPNRPFTRYDATREIPRTNPFLRKLFETINSSDLDGEPFVGFVDELAQLLGATRMDEVLANFGKRTRQEDPIIHFYETFLSQYDPKLRELRGVYYTPSPVISYMVRSVDYLLKEEFGIEDGLADGETVDYTFTDADGQQHTQRVPRVLILDPACGTGTFLSSIIEHIRESYRASNSSGMWPAYVRESLLPRLFGFELLMAPYAMAHLRLGMQLAGLDLPPEQRAPWTYKFDSNERLGIYLTNSLSEGLEKVETLPFAHFISDEASEAAKIKRENPVMAVIGNPPYNNFGQANKGDWILSQIQEYKKNLNERKINLDDDFIKFIRFGQWRIEKTGHGILAFVVSNTFIDGITHYRMRQSLLATFNDIYILNLHGSTRKREKCPDGSKDENVFDIMQGVAICIFVKKPEMHEEARVHYADLWGLRTNKYATLAAADIPNTQWSLLNPKPKQFFFVPKNFNNLKEYETLTRVNEIFPQYNAGIQTKRDKLVYHFTEDELNRALKDVQQLSSLELTEKYELPPDGRDWTIETARKDVLSGNGIATKILYHPFDTRHTLYTKKTKGFMAYPRYPLMGNAMRDNLLFLGIRNARRGNIDSFFVANSLVDKDAVSPYDNVTFFPLYLYPDKNELIGISDNERRPNLSEAFIKDFTSRLSLQFIPDGTGDLQTTFGPEDIFHYMYAIFYAPTYRERYAEFLKIDFPRLPLTSNVELFRSLCTFGKRLVELHLLEKIAKPTTGFQGQGDYRVEKVEYIPTPTQPDTGSVWINKNQYFTDVPAEVWNFHIGGYQVCQKWLKDRKGRALALADLKDYQKIVSALSETITLMEQIDEAIEDHGSWPIE